MSFRESEERYHQAARRAPQRFFQVRLSANTARCGATVERVMLINHENYVTVRVLLSYYHPLEQGDKICTEDGQKGVINHFAPEPPFLATGEAVDMMCELSR